MTVPKVSIVLPVYNAEEYLDKCINSLVSQTLRDIEIVAVNDGSTDGSLQVLRRYAEDDGRIRVINKDNEGVSRARNAALEEVRGEYLMFVDSDDWIDADSCATAYRLAVEHKADVVMWSYVREFDSDSRPKSLFSDDFLVFNRKEVMDRLHRRFVGLVGAELSHPEDLDAIGTVWGKLYSRRIVDSEEVRFTDIRDIGSCEDGLFNLHVFQHVNKVVFVDKFLYHYRKTNPKSITTVYNPDFKAQRDVLLDLIHDYVVGNNFGCVYKEAFYNRVALNVLGVGLVEVAGRHSHLSKVATLRSLLMDDRYVEAYKRLNLKYFPLKWKLFYSLAKMKCAWGLYVLLLLIRRIIQS